MKKASFDKNHREFEGWMDWYGQFLDKHLHVLSQFEQYEVLEAFVLRIAVRWEVLVIQDIIASLNRDSSKYSAEIGLNLKKHLTRDESEAILIGHKYIDFKNTQQAIDFSKRHLVDKLNPFKLINSNISKKIDQFFTMRNYLAHYSSYAERKYKRMIIKEYKLTRIYEPGAFLSKVDKKTKIYRWADFITTFIRCSQSMKKI